MKSNAHENVPYIFASTDDPQQAADAYARVEPELAELDAQDLSPILVDIPTAAATVLAHAPAIQGLREPIATALPQFPMRQLDALPDYALAAWYAHRQSLQPRPRSAPRWLLDEAHARRAELRAAAEELARNGALDPDRVEACRCGSSNVDLATELGALSDTFQQSWDGVATRTAISRADVDRANVLATKLLVALGRREPPAEALDKRARAYTRFVTAYDACRRAVAFLRAHEGDADAIAPSLYARKRVHRKAAPAPATAPAIEGPPLGATPGPSEPVG